MSISALPYLDMMSASPTTSSDATGIEHELKRLEEAARFSAQSQFEQAKFWRLMNYILGVPAAVLAAVSGGLVLANSLGLLPGILALAAAGLAAAQTTINASERMTRSQTAGNAYLALQQDARVLRTVDLATLPHSEARAELLQLVARQQEVNKSADPPNFYAYWRGGQNIRKGRQEFEVDQN